MYPYPPKELIRSALKRQSTTSTGSASRPGERHTETVKGKPSKREEQPQDRDYLGSPEALKASQAEQHSEEVSPQQTADSIEERRNRQLEAGIPAEQKEASKQRRT